MNRRGFLSGMLAACAAPAIVRADWLMPVKSIIPATFPLIRTFDGVFDPGVYTFSTYVRHGGKPWERYHVTLDHPGGVLVAKLEIPQAQRGESLTFEFPQIEHRIEMTV